MCVFFYAHAFFFLRGVGAVPAAVWRSGVGGGVVPCRVMSGGVCKVNPHAYARARASLLGSRIRGPSIIPAGAGRGPGAILDPARCSWSAGLPPDPIRAAGDQERRIASGSDQTRGRISEDQEHRIASGSDQTRGRRSEDQEHQIAGAGPIRPAAEDLKTRNTGLPPDPIRPAAEDLKTRNTGLPALVRSEDQEHRIAVNFGACKL